MQTEWQTVDPDQTTTSGATDLGLQTDLSK